MREKGRIRSWNDLKGFGFVEPYDGGKQVFIHVSAFSNRIRKPENGDMVTYELAKDTQGRPCAAKAALPGERHTTMAKRSGGALAVIGPLLFLGGVGLSVVAAKLPPVILGVYLVASLVTFIVYAVDKSAARRGVQRTPERTLHWLSFIGGWPGALVAQKTLRHKSKKQTFRTVFWITVFLNIGMLAWIFTTGGADQAQLWIGQGH
jgi:uncharacterized membrane protein YsdA (DUF1294 family)/cold shock CspA family protein